MTKTLEKEAGLEPYGAVQRYSRTQCPEAVVQNLNLRERQSMDINAALLQVPQLFYLRDGLGWMWNVLLELESGAGACYAPFSTVSLSLRSGPSVLMVYRVTVTVPFYYFHFFFLLPSSFQLLTMICNRDLAFTFGFHFTLTCNLICNLSFVL